MYLIVQLCGHRNGVVIPAGPLRLVKHGRLTIKVDNGHQERDEPESPQVSPLMDDSTLSARAAPSYPPLPQPETDQYPLTDNI